MWFAKSSAFIISTPDQTFTWLSIIGGSLFTAEGIVPFLWFIVRGRKNLKKPVKDIPQPVYKEPKETFIEPNSKKLCFIGFI